MLPKFLENFLSSYDISKMDLYNPEDKREIITQILNYGDEKDIIWLFKTYDIAEIKEVISHPMRGCWQERALIYWTKILDIKLPKIIYETAIFSLNLRPKLMENYFQYKKNLKG